MKNYEQISVILESLSLPRGAEQFHVDWLDSECLAIGKDRQGGHSVFVLGPQIEPALPIVASAMRAGTWTTTSGVAVQGNVLQLPQGEPFLTATAAITAELFRRGVGERPTAEVFAEVEPFIALVLRRVLLPPEFVVGLVGELLILHQLLLALRAGGRELDDPTALWRGWQRQARDFALGNRAIEVKTTGLQVSRHLIGSLEQVEARTMDGGATESLYLASIGLRRSAGSGPYSVSGLTDQVLALIGGVPPAGGVLSDAQSKFLDRLAQYGPEESAGYHHLEMRGFDVYTQPYATTFPPRFYDMGDVNVRVIRRADLAEAFPYVLPQGLQYTVDLPEMIPGSIDNPRSDLQPFLHALIAGCSF